MRGLFVVWCGLLPLAGAGGPSAARAGADVTWANPILRGYHADPSLCRVGEDYYLTTSTSEWFPSLPLYHSRDLVHWELKGHALTRPTQIDLSGTECSAGVYAPTLRVHQGRFYLITTLVGARPQRGNFVVTADRVEGPWSDPVFIADAPGIDPSLFFDDDGRVYYCGNVRPEQPRSPQHRIIWFQQIDPTTWKLQGPRTQFDLTGPASLGSLDYLEAPHVYKKDGYYYLVASHGGTFRQHAVSVWRGRHPLEPFQAANPANPILTHRDDGANGIQCVGHADFVETPHGEWWMTVLGVRSTNEQSPMGRETFLVPLDWREAWPAVRPRGTPGRVQLTSAAWPLPVQAVAPPPRRQYFDAPTLGPRWTFIRTPAAPWWSTTRRPGWLTLQLRPPELSELAQPSFVGVRQEERAFTARTLLDFQPRQAHEVAGLAVIRARDAEYQLVLTGDATQRKFCVRSGGRVLAEQPAPAGWVELSVQARADQLVFRARPAAGDDAAWRTLAQLPAAPLLDSRLGRFTGTFVGLYASSGGHASANVAAFQWFEYENP